VKRAERARRRRRIGWWRAQRKQRLVRLLPPTDGFGLRLVLHDIPHSFTSNGDVAVQAWTHEVEVDQGGDASRPTARAALAFSSMPSSPFSSLSSSPSSSPSLVAADGFGDYPRWRRNREIGWGRLL
jgi:hypothetical protein